MTPPAIQKIPSAQQNRSCTRNDFFRSSRPRRLYILGSAIAMKHSIDPGRRAYQDVGESPSEFAWRSSQRRAPISTDSRASSTQGCTARLDCVTGASWISSF